MAKKLVLVVCGAGTLTSVIASQGIEEGIKKAGIKDVEVITGRIDDVERYRDRISVLVTTMRVQSSYEFAVLNGISFLTGDEDGQEEIISKVVDIVSK